MRVMIFIASGLACACLAFAQTPSDTAGVRFAHLSPNVFALEFELVRHQVRVGQT